MKHFPFDNAKAFLTETANALPRKAQQAKESLTEIAASSVDTVTVTTDKAVDKVVGTAQQGKESLITTTGKAVEQLTTLTTDSIDSIGTTARQAQTSVEQTIEQTKDSLNHHLQVTRLTNTTSTAIQTAINSSINEWLQAHPTAMRLAQILLWATNHPIWGFIVLILTVAIAWSLIKAVGRLVEVAGLTLLQTPFKLFFFLIGASTKSLSQYGGVAFKKLFAAKTAEPLALYSENLNSIEKNRQQRLAEISARLEAIQKEQNELLREAASLLDIEKSNAENK